MAKEGRDERGRFKKGHSGNPSRQFSGGVAEEMQLRSAEARSENAIVANAIRRAILGKDPETGNPVIDEVVGNTVSRMKRQGSMGDLRAMADVLGELEQKLNLTGEMNHTFKVGDE